MTTTFYQMPKGSSKFNKLSCVARIIYMVLYDLIKQSKNNSSKKYYSEIKKKYYCCYDSNKLAEFACVSQPTVLKAIKELEKNSFIEIERVKKAGNKYYVKEIYSDEILQADEVRDKFTEKLDNTIDVFFSNSNIPEKVRERFKKSPMCYIDKIKKLADTIKNKDFVQYNGGSNEFVSMYLDWLRGTTYIKSFGANTLNPDSIPFKNFCEKYTNDEVEFAPKVERKQEKVVPENKGGKNGYTVSNHHSIFSIDDVDGLKLIGREVDIFNDIIAKYPKDKKDIIERLKNGETMFGIALDYNLYDDEDDEEEPKSKYHDEEDDDSKYSEEYVMSHYWDFVS